MTKKTCEVDGVTYEASPLAKGTPEYQRTVCAGCAAKAASPLCVALDVCTNGMDEAEHKPGALFIWVVKV